MLEPEKVLLRSWGAVAQLLQENSRKEFSERLVREMPHPAHDPLLHRPWIRPHPQHFQIVIRFHHQHIAPSQMVAHAGRHVAEVGGNRNLRAFGAESEAHRIGGVVRNGERCHRDIGDLK